MQAYTTRYLFKNLPREMTPLFRLPFYQVPITNYKQKQQYGFFFPTLKKSKTLLKKLL